MTQSKTWRAAAVGMVALICVIGGSAVCAFGQEAPPAQPQPPPPEVQRIMEIMRDPQQLRELMSDPERMRELRESLNSDAVREFTRDPERMRELMQGIDQARLQENFREAARGIDPTKIRKAMVARWKERLGATDDEWKVLEPKLEKVVVAQQDARGAFAGGMGRGFAGGGGGFGGGAGIGAAGGDPNAPQQSEVTVAAQQLRAAANDPNVQPAEVTRLLAIYRQARDKARQQLEAAERELREVLTLRQEGVLVMAGMLN